MFKLCVHEFTSACSLQRPYVCTIDDCRSAYRRKDHLNRHLLQHQGKLFKCPIENCKSEFAFQGNVKRHVVELHSEDCPSTSIEGQKQHVCQEPGCGKVFQLLQSCGNMRVLMVGFYF